MMVVVAELLLTQFIKCSSVVVCRFCVEIGERHAGQITGLPEFLSCLIWSAAVALVRCD